MQYRLVIKSRHSERVELDRWFPNEAERRAYFEALQKSADLLYLVDEKDVPPVDPNEPATGEWRAFRPRR
jgi:hypothetical protein